MRPEVLLRPATEDDLGWLHDMINDPAALGVDWSGFQPASNLRRRFHDCGLLDDEGGLLVVQEGSAPVGEVSWRAVRYGGRPHAWNIGVAILPAARGRGIGSRAQQLLTDYLFAHTTAERIEAHVRSDNPAELRSMARAGFTVEGVMRRAQFKDGGWRDLVVHSRLRSDPSSS